MMGVQSVHTCVGCVWMLGVYGAHGARRRDGGTLSTCCINYF